MKIIAFDLGATMAYARNFQNEGHHKYLWHHYTFPGTRVERAGLTLQWGVQLLNILRPDTVIYETPFARGQHATRSLWGLAGLIEAAAQNAGCAVVDRPPSTIKEWSTGRGNASKTDMLAAAKRMGYTGDNEHEADSFCLLKYAEQRIEVDNG